MEEFKIIVLGLSLLAVLFGLAFAFMWFSCKVLDMSPFKLMGYLWIITLFGMLVYFLGLGVMKFII